MAKKKYPIDNDKTGTPEACKPQMLSEEQRHKAYSVETAENHYANKIFPAQRGGWFPGRRERSYGSNYDNMEWDG